MHLRELNMRRMVFAMGLLALALTGCPGSSEPVAQQSADPGPVEVSTGEPDGGEAGTGESADFRLVKLNLPGMT
jgi:hypothetical protein